MLAQAIAQSDAFSIAGGGDTLAAIAKYGMAEQVGYISTGGGAFLEVLRGQDLARLRGVGAARRRCVSTGQVGKGVGTGTRLSLLCQLKPCNLVTSR